MNYLLESLSKIIILHEKQIKLNNEGRTEESNKIYSEIDKILEDKVLINQVKALSIGKEYKRADKPTKIKVGKIMSNYKNIDNNRKRKR